MAYVVGSWTQAEEAAIEELIRRMNAAAQDAQAIERGRNAFLAEIPPGVYNAFALHLYGGGDTVQIWNTTVASLNFQGYILGLYRDRQKAIEALEWMFAAHPIEGLENIQIWRIEGNPTLRPEAIDMTDGRKARFWGFSMPVRCVFKTVV